MAESGAKDSRVAVITGAGSGIGRAVSVALLEAGYCVVVAGRHEETLRAVLADHGSRGLVVTADVTQERSVEHLFARTCDEFGRVDLLFNNAGVFGATAPFEEVSLEQWRLVVDTNLTGAFLCAREAFRIMKEQRPSGGRIINNGSVSAQSPRPHAVAYTSTKHAVTGLTKAISIEGRRYGIACSQIDIGNAATDLSAAFGQGALQADGSILSEPRIDLKHVSDAVLYMANLPLEANVQFMTLMATAMPLIGRG
ncbi:MAG: SDR family oxidoreductase [Thermoleophilia bacterium]|jgi:NAD(P)-dependent dehydrogenase (short-subunit alcohol dehydrogenase family)